MIALASLQEKPRRCALALEYFVANSESQIYLNCNHTELFAKQQHGTQNQSNPYFSSIFC